MEFDFLVNCKVGSNLNLTCSDWTISRLFFRLTLIDNINAMRRSKNFILYLSDKNVQKIFYLCGLTHFLLKEVFVIIGVLTLTMKHMLAFSLSHIFTPRQHLYQSVNKYPSTNQKYLSLYSF